MSKRTTHVWVCDACGREFANELKNARWFTVTFSPAPQPFIDNGHEFPGKIDVCETCGRDSWEVMTRSARPGGHDND